MIALLVNPAANRGRAALRANAVERALGPYGPVRRVEKRQRGDEGRLAREAVERGARVLAVVGGDGAVHHAARGLLELGAPIPLAIFAAGTGNDFVKTLGTPAHDVRAMAACVGRGDTRAIDVVVLDDVPVLNAAGFGFDVEVLHRMQAHPRFRGAAAYVTAALTALLGYRGFDATVAAGTRPGSAAAPADRRRRLLTVIANGQWFGGTFRIAPEARLDDGLAELVDIGDVPPRGRLPLFARALRGRHVGARAVTVERGAAFTLTFATTPLFEADGELYAAAGTVVTARVLPHALQLVV